MAIAQNYPALKPSLSLDFANVKALDPRITFTRASSATYYNANGLLESEASGVARFDHNPVTKESLGLLIEEQRTNLLLRSEEFDNAGWSKSNATITANTIVAPDGTLTGDKYIPVNTGISDLRQNITFSSSVHTASIFVNLGDFASGGLSFSFAGTAGGAATINIQTGSVLFPGANFISGGSQPVGNGWFRVSATINNIFVGASSLRFVLTDTSGNTISGNGFDGIYIWGAQLEVGAFPTSYIPTVASQVTRAADAASMTGANFSSWFNAAEGSIYVETELLQGQTANAGRAVLALVASANTNRYHALYSSFIWRGLENNALVNMTTLNFSTERSKFSFSFSANGRNAVKDNGVVLTRTGNSTLPDIDELRFGAQSIILGASGYSKHIRKISHYPVRVTNEQLQGLTS